MAGAPALPGTHLDRDLPDHQSGSGGQDKGFGDLLKKAVESVNTMQHEAGRLENAVAQGENVNIHQAVIAGEKAGLSFKLLMQVRNKMVDAYQEIMRMQV